MIKPASAPFAEHGYPPQGRNYLFQYGLQNANKGRAHAQFEVASSYRHGVGTQVNLVEAARWFKAAAVQGHPWAVDEYGRCLQEGQGVTKNSRKQRDGTSVPLSFNNRKDIIC